MDLNLNGKRVLVTGGSKGIGFACANVFADEGAEVRIASRNPPAGGGLPAEAGAPSRGGAAPGAGGRAFTASRPRRSWATPRATGSCSRACRSAGRRLPRRSPGRRRFSPPNAPPTSAAASSPSTAARRRAQAERPRMKGWPRILGASSLQGGRGRAGSGRFALRTIAAAVGVAFALGANAQQTQAGLERATRTPLEIVWLKAEGWGGIRRGHARLVEARTCTPGANPREGCVIERRAR